MVAVATPDATNCPFTAVMFVTEGTICRLLLRGAASAVVVIRPIPSRIAAAPQRSVFPYFRCIIIFLSVFVYSGASELGPSCPDSTTLRCCRSHNLLGQLTFL